MVSASGTVVQAPYQSTQPIEQPPRFQNRGMATPDDALETLFWYFAEPGRLKPGNEEIYAWTIQNRPLPPGWHWEITDGGLGSAHLEGFRILTRREISPEEVAFEIERSENAQTVVEVRRFVRIGKGWKCQTQAHLEPPPGDHAPSDDGYRLGPRGL